VRRVSLESFARVPLLVPFARQGRRVLVALIRVHLVKLERSLPAPDRLNVILAQLASSLRVV
jgi:hypothetical protein